MPNSLINFIIRNYIPLRNASYAKKFRDKPIPLDFWLKKKEALNRYSSKENILIPSGRYLRSRGENISVPELKEVLAGNMIGNWTLDRNSIVILWKKLMEIKPTIILEAGSGISTLLFAKFQEKHNQNGRVISLEQDKKEKIRVEDLLKKFKLDSFVNILYAPLNSRGGYEFSHQNILQISGNKKGDWLMIDGPCGTDGSRDQVMYDLLPYMNPGSIWFADDSFRDGELSFLKQWEDRKDIEVTGIYPVGKGLATGKIKAKTVNA